MNPKVETALGFAQFGLYRQLPGWVPFDWSQPVIYLDPTEKKPIPGTYGIGLPEYDFNDPNLELPFYDGSAGGAISMHLLEHLADPTILINEVGRVLAPGCPFNILVPHGQSLMYLHDITHKTPFVIDTWRNYLENQFWDTGNRSGLRVGANFMFGVVERNLALITQLIKEDEE